MAATVELDKLYTGHMSTWGTIQVRVVVVKPKDKTEQGALSGEDLSADADEPLVATGASPLSTYLERAAHGRQCVVFLVNGQRHDAWDNSFIVRSLGFKYLRSRTMIIVDLDGLTIEAIAEIVQGSRQGLYEGDVMAAIRDRLVATLKTDPDLLRLQTEAEQQIAELNAGDEVVRQKLDELIEAHHSAAHFARPGDAEPGTNGGKGQTVFGKDRDQAVVVREKPDVGYEGSLPVIVSVPDLAKIRLRPDVERHVVLGAAPASAWAKRESLQVRLQPQLPELQLAEEQVPDGLRLRLLFEEPDGFDVDEYPLVTTLQAVAKFAGESELRLFEREVVINRKLGPRPPRPKPTLRANPSFLRVVSRQPVKLVTGGPSTHVRMAWDGDDSLTAGASPSWSIKARCLTLGTFPPLGSTQPRDGKFELLLDTPRGLIANQLLDFEVEAAGPAGQRLVVNFAGRVVESTGEPEPRKLTARVPESTAQRRPPYDLKTVKEENWETPTCWGETIWTKDEVAAYSEPTETAPLTLIINEDAGELREFREAMVKRSLDENTVKERMSRYSAHVAYHLYQMYGFRKEQQEAQAVDDGVHVPTDEEQGAEIARVASTLLKLMEVRGS
jgi:hypothetical protein